MLDAPLHALPLGQEDVDWLAKLGLERHLPRKRPGVHAPRIEHDVENRCGVFGILRMAVAEPIACPDVNLHVASGNHAVDYKQGTAEVGTPAAPPPPRVHDRDRAAVHTQQPPAGSG